MPEFLFGIYCGIAYNYIFTTIEKEIRKGNEYITEERFFQLFAVFLFSPVFAPIIFFLRRKNA